MTFIFNNQGSREPFNQGLREPSTFKDFYVRKDDFTGPGWFVFGRNEQYGGRYVKLCARPDIRGYHGWPTKKEAQEVADWLNRGTWE